MPTTLAMVVTNYLRSSNPALRTRQEYLTTLGKWKRWGGGGPIEKLGRKDVREFLEWVYEDSVAREGSNPGRTANKVRSHLRAVLSWAWEQDVIESLPRFPKHRPQRDVAGRHYLTKAEINALYFATHQMKRPRGWNHPFPIGRYWRSALVLFFNYGVDTGTIWRTEQFHEPILWRYILRNRQSPVREIKEHSRWGWIYYRRVKTGKTFYRPMNRTVHVHIQSIMPDNPDPNAPVFLGGGTRPNIDFEHYAVSRGLNQSSASKQAKNDRGCSRICARRARLIMTSTCQSLPSRSSATPLAE